MPLQESLASNLRLHVRTPKAIGAIALRALVASAPAMPRPATIAVRTNIRKVHLINEVIARKVTDPGPSAAITRVMKTMTLAMIKTAAGALQEARQMVATGAKTRLGIGEIGRSIAWESVSR